MAILSPEKVPDPQPALRDTVQLPSMSACFFPRGDFKPTGSWSFLKDDSPHAYCCILRQMIFGYQILTGDMLVRVGPPPSRLRDLTNSLT